MLTFDEALEERKGSDLVDNLIGTISAFFSDYFGLDLPTMHPTDVVEIIIISVFLYQLLVWIKNTRAWMLFRGILIIIGFFMIAAILQMHTILWLGEKMLSAGVIALIVVFQPELRRALEQLGRKNLFSILSSFGLMKGAVKRFDDKTKNDIVKACYEMGTVKTGALIVIEKDVKLSEYERTGITLDSLLSRQLLINIFEKNTPLHDGAIIVRGDRVVSATCYLPLSDNMELSKELGTRHRAAVGISEVSDALTIVVSEETGNVSIARDGMLQRNVSDKQLEEELNKLQMQDEPDTDSEKPGILKRRVHHVDES